MSYTAAQVAQKNIICINKKKMLIVKNKRYVKKHVIGGSGFFDRYLIFQEVGIVERLATSSRAIASAAASDIGKTAINAAKTVGKELSTSAINAAKDVAIEKWETVHNQ
jgi:hypothetical protein